MHFEFPILSFFCASILAAVFLTVRHARLDVSNMCIIMWLFILNVVHAINSVIWSGNTNIHIPVWCDIVTKLYIGNLMAISGSFFCISLRLRRASSARALSPSSLASRQYHVALELLFGLLIPLIYMLLHLVVQDHRFDIVVDVGCVPSMYPSVISVVLMGMPLLCISFASLVISAFVVYHVFYLQPAAATFEQGLQLRQYISKSLFWRQLALVSLGSLAVFISTIVVVAWQPPLQPVVSWRVIHSAISSIVVVTSSDARRSVDVMWWLVPVVSLLYFVIMFLFGEELCCTWSRVQGWFKCGGPQCNGTEGTSIALDPSATRVVSSASSFRSPGGEDLISGWDDMVDFRQNKWRRSHCCTSLPLESQCIIDHSEVVNSDEESLEHAAHGPPGLSPTLLSPERVTCPPTVLAPSSSPPPAETSNTLNVLDAEQRASSPTDDAVSTISFVCNAQWPRPPPLLAHPSPRDSLHPNPPFISDPVRPVSLAFSRSAYSSVNPSPMSLSPASTAGPPTPCDIIRPGSPQRLRQLVKRNSRDFVRVFARSRELLTAGQATDGQLFTPVDGIHMTVVQEVAYAM